MSPILQLVSLKLKQTVVGVVIDGTWREATAPNLAPLEDMRYGRTSLAGKYIRRNLCEYFNGPGQIPWQWGILVN